jgi:hypothetical protein
VFDNPDEVKSWTVEECNVKLRTWAPDLIQKKQTDGEILLMLSQSNLKAFFKDISDEDVRSLHYLLHVKDNPEEPLQRVDVDADVQSSAFCTQYVDPNNEVGRFIWYVRECSKRYHQKRYYFLSPYITVVQSSGYGKSRLLLEASRSIRTLYVCMRTKNSGFPARTEQAMEALFSGLNQTNANSYSDQLSKKLELCWKSAISNLPKPGEALSDPAKFQSEYAANQVWNLNAVSEPGESSRGELVLLVFDEARATLEVSVQGISQFRLIRRALWKYSQRLQTSRPIFCVFVDTSSKIQNFAPQAALDSSLRPLLMDMERTAKELFRPYVLRGSFDALFPKLPPATENLEALINSVSYLSAGRPMLALTSDLGETEELNFWSRKLCGGGSDISTEASLSHMLCRLAAFVHPQHPFSTALVADYMATILGTSAKRASSLIAYVAEPKLAVSAARLWLEPGLLARRFLPALQRALVGGPLDQGSRGELVAQIVILCAFDTACSLAGKKPGESVTLRSVLEQLLPEEADSCLLDELPPDLLKLHCACCQFVDMCQRFGHDEVVALAERHCGGAFRDKQRGLDLVVPLLDVIFGLFLIQVKNWKRGSPFSKKTLQKLDLKFAFKTDKFGPDVLARLNQRSVVLGLHLAAKTCSAMVTSGPHDSKVLVVNGLGARCLDAEVKSALRVVLDQHVTLESFIVNDGFDQEEGHDYGPDPNKVEVVQKCWPFLWGARPDLEDQKDEQLPEDLAESAPQDSLLSGFDTSEDTRAPDLELEGQRPRRGAGAASRDAARAGGKGAGRQGGRGRDGPWFGDGRVGAPAGDAGRGSRRSGRSRRHRGRGGR